MRLDTMTMIVHIPKINDAKTLKNV